MMFRYLLLALVVCVLSVFSWLTIQSFDFFHAPLVKKDVTRTVKIYPNDSLHQVAARLTKAGIIRHPELFIWFVEVQGQKHKLRFGEYRVSSDLTLHDLIDNMVQGKGLVKHRITFINGWTFAQMRDVLELSQSLKHTLMGVTKKAVMQKIAKKSELPEGWFYPDTYFYYWGHDDVSVLKIAYKKMQRVLTAAWKSRAPNLWYQTPYQALTAASLVERETAISKEKPIVASVILNRLKKGMRLQIDPTVQYGLGKSFGDPITKKDLESKTAFNTYIKKGLPPTPICMPDLASIQAVLHPAKTDYLFYVATGEGGHKFSKTYLKHKEAVKDYRRYEKQMQKDINQLQVWWQDGVTTVSKAAVMITYLPFLQHSLGIV